MRLVLLGGALTSAAYLKALEATAAAAGHEIVAAAESPVAALWAEAREKFPDLIAFIHKGIADIESTTMTGGEKAVTVAEDAVAVVPAVLKDLPDLKAFLVHGVTEEYAVIRTGLKDAATALIGKL